MGNKEKYINYIVNNMVNNTKFDIDTHGIFFHPPYEYQEIAADFNVGYGSHFPNFLRYVKSTYGTREEEAWGVWNTYKEIVLKKLS